MKRIMIILLAATILLPGSFAGQANRNTIFDNWNTAACGFTNMAILKLDYSYHVDRIEIWYKWRAGERRVPYKVSFAGRELRRGTLVRDTCDSYQNTWCVATDSLNLDLGPGSYTFRLANARVCQNAGSGGMGFIRAIGFDSTPNKVVPSNTKGVPTNRSGRIIAHIWKASSQTSPFAEDIPVPGVKVSCEFSDGSQPIRLEATTNSDGAASFSVPLNPQAVIKNGEEAKSVTCTTRTPEQTVSFGGVVIKIKKIASTDPMPK